MRFPIFSLHCRLLSQTAAKFRMGCGLIVFASFAFAPLHVSADYNPEADPNLLFHVSPKYPETYALNGSGQVIRLGHEPGRDKFYLYPTVPLDIVAGTLDIDASSGIRSAEDQDIPSSVSVYLYFSTYDSDIGPGETHKIIHVADLEGSAPSWWMGNRFMDSSPDYHQFVSRQGNPPSLRAYTSASAGWTGLKNGISYTFNSYYGGTSTRWKEGTSLIASGNSSVTNTAVNSADIFLFEDSAGNNDFRGELKCVYISTNTFSDATIQQLDAECSSYEFVNIQPTPTPSPSYNPEADPNLLFHVSPKYPETYEFNENGQVIRLGHEPGVDNFYLYPSTPIDISAGALDIGASTDIRSDSDHDIPEHVTIYMYFDTYDTQSLGQTARIFHAWDMEGSSASWYMDTRFFDSSPDYRQFLTRQGRPPALKAYTSNNGSWGGLQNGASYTFNSFYGGTSTRWKEGTMLMASGSSGVTNTSVNSADLSLFSGLDGLNDLTGELKCVYISTNTFNDATIQQLDAECAAYEFVNIQPTPTPSPNQPPLITLLGNRPLRLLTGEAYTEPGATASDAEDGDLTGSIVIDSSSVNTAAPGTYQVNYTVQDSGGQQAQAVRTVEVQTLPPHNELQLQQLDPDTHQAIDIGASIGGTAAENTVEFRGVVTHPFGKQVRLMVGVQNLDIIPLATVWKESVLVESGETATVISDPLAPGHYRWVAKAKDENGTGSSLVNFNGNDSWDFQYGFEPSPQGFRFRNNGIDGATLTDADRWAIFDSIFQMPAGIPPALAGALKVEAFRSVRLTEPDVLEGGLCFGFDLLATASYSFPAFPAGLFPEYWQQFEAAGNAGALGAPGPASPVLWNGTGIANKPLLKAIAAMHLVQSSDEFMRAEKIESPGAILSALAMASPADFGDYLINIGYYNSQTDSKSHALVPYKVVQTGTAEGRIYVYDNEEPDWDNTGETNVQPGNASYGRYIEVIDASTWRYQFASGNTWPPLLSKTEYIDLVNVKDVFEGAGKLTPAGLGNSPLIALHDNGDLLLINSANQRLGLAGGSFLEEIPDVHHVTGSNPGVFNQQYYFEWDEDLTAEVAGTATGDYRLVKTKGQQLIRLQAPTAAGLKDTLRLSSEDTYAFTITFDTDTSRGSETYAVEVLSNYGAVAQFTASALPLIPGATTRFAVGDVQTLIAIDYESDGSYDFTFSATGTLDDLMAPTTTHTIAGEQQPDQSYAPGASITLSATDNPIPGAAGVYQTEYSLDNGSTWLPYVDALTFTEPGDMTLMYRSTDGLGNRENHQLFLFTIADIP